MYMYVCMYMYMYMYGCMHYIGYKNSPNKAPKARLALLMSGWFMAASALNISGAPLPKASKVTP